MNNISNSVIIVCHFTGAFISSWPLRKLSSNPLFNLYLPLLNVDSNSSHVKLSQFVPQ